jgi:perosamine synthetase
VVHLYGNMPDMDAVMGVASRHAIPVIEDAAEAIGSEYRGRKAGSLGDVGTFSFHGSKTLTTGEGGMLVTSREDIFARVLRLRDHGRESGDRLFVNYEVAFKYKMSALQAAFGLAQIERIDELVARKRELFAWYAKHFAGMNRVTLNQEAATTKNAYWMVTAVFDPQVNKEHVIEELRRRNIDTRPFFYPLSSLPAYRSLGGPERWQDRNPVSYDISSRGVNLPSGFNMTEALVERVVSAVHEILGADACDPAGK